MNNATLIKSLQEKLKTGGEDKKVDISLEDTLALIEETIPYLLRNKSENVLLFLRDVNNKNLLVNFQKAIE